MGRYRKVDVRVWGDERVRRLSRPPPNGRDCWLYLLTSPNMILIPGLQPVRAGSMAEDLGWSREDFLRAFADVEAQGMAHADWDAGLVWLPNAITYNMPESPCVVQGWKGPWEGLPDSPLLAEAWKGLHAALKPKLAQAFVETCRRPQVAQRYVPDITTAGTLPGRVGGSLPGTLPPTLRETSSSSSSSSSNTFAGTAGAAPAKPEVLPPAPVDAPPAATASPKPKRKKPPDTVDPRRAPLVTALCALYSELCGATYGFGGHDAAEVTALLALGPPDEVQARWRLALLARHEFPRVTSLAMLRVHWNQFPVRPAEALPPARACDRCGADEGYVGACWDNALCSDCVGGWKASVAATTPGHELAAATAAWVADRRDRAAETVPDTIPETLPPTVVDTPPATLPQTPGGTLPPTLPPTDPDTLPGTAAETLPETVSDTPGGFTEPGTGPLESAPEADVVPLRPPIPLRAATLVNALRKPVLVKSLRKKRERGQRLGRDPLAELDTGAPNASQKH